MTCLPAVHHKPTEKPESRAPFIATFMGLHKDNSPLAIDAGCASTRRFMAGTTSCWQVPEMKIRRIVVLLVCKPAKRASSLGYWGGRATMEGRSVEFNAGRDLLTAVLVPSEFSPMNAREKLYEILSGKSC